MALQTAYFVIFVCWCVVVVAGGVVSAEVKVRGAVHDGVYKRVSVLPVLQVSFYNDNDQSDTAHSYTVTVNNGSCTSCQGFSESLHPINWTDLGIRDLQLSTLFKLGFTDLDRILVFREEARIPQ